MKVVHISFSDLVGGASRGMYDLHSSLMQSGIDSTVVCAVKRSNDDSVIAPTSLCGSLKYQFAKKANSLSSRIVKDPTQAEFAPNYVSVSLNSLLERLGPDIIHLHWVANGTVHLNRLAYAQIPIIWTLRDMWPFTGGCHYDGNCGKYSSGCGNCPRLKHPSNHDISSRIIKRRLDFIHSVSQIQFVALSSWLKDRFTQSFVGNQQNVTVINPAIDTTQFRCYEPMQCRRDLMLQEYQRVIGFSSIEGCGDVRKGWEDMVQAITAVPHSRTRRGVLLVAGGHRQATFSIGNWSVVQLGRINSNVELAKFYSACDMVVTPSSQEAFGKVAVEAMACGTPVVAYRNTGFQDAIVHKQVGYLASENSPSDLSIGIQWLLDDPKRMRTMRALCRDHANNKFALAVQADAYRVLYNSIADKGHAIN